ncbi:MAG: HD-GYP domain-containing protein, partial [Enterovibrio sp.]
RMYFIQAFLGFASLIKENWLHLQQQKKLFSSFVELIAAAIDTKSPYTGGHCQRVPELTLMLAEAAHSDQKYFADFELNENSREAIYLAAWLHDCGKVTTPEFVVDKSTKLETIYNRIHEIRTRFEVLKRDEEIRYWQHLHENVENAEELTQKLQQNLQQLDDDFAFIAKLNSGETVVKDAELTRLKQIAERVWTQTLDDSQGVSWEELQRKQAHTQEPLPRQIKLLDDSADLKITWSSSQQQRWQNWPFSMPIPKLQYNRGEVHNLSVERGTLTQEERFMINGHIVQTIELLNRLPYPTHLKRIPEIAGGHHERLDGKGYPYGLDKSQLTIDTRIIALADVFEALTAADRPYKSAKSLSNSLKILAKMANEQHIDKDLLKLFIEQKIYFRYAQMFLAQEQQDEVDEEALLATLTESDNSQAQ